MRPTTARRRPPKVKDNVKQLEQAGVGGTKTEGAVAAPVGIMVDGDDKDSDDEVAFGMYLGIIPRISSNLRCHARVIEAIT